MEYTTAQRELLATLTEGASEETWLAPTTVRDIAAFLDDDVYWELLTVAGKRLGLNMWRYERMVKQGIAEQNGYHPPTDPLENFIFQTGTDLIAEDIAPLHEVAQGFLHEGLWIFGGKSKRGKSWLMLDLALAVAAGRSAFVHFKTAQSPVLYLALEDGKRRVKSRMLSIEPSLVQRDLLHLAYKFPRLGEGALEMLDAAITRYHYGLVIVDVMAKIRAKPQRGRSGDSYQEIYDELAPLQEMAEHHHVCLMLLEHLRKQEADDLFDAIQGSVAKQGSADALMVLSRKSGEDDTYLHVRSKETGEAIHALRFDKTHFVYAGEGDMHAMKQQRRDILQVLREEASPMSIQEVLRALKDDDTSANYQRVRRNLLELEADNYVVRKAIGTTVKFLATALKDKADYDDSPDF